MRCAGIVLCGGQSTRMGVAKAGLPFGPETLVQRVTRLVGEVVAPVVVVGAHGETLSDLPAGVRVAYDRQPGRGPLEGLHVGMQCVQTDAEAVFVTACDAPFVQPQVVRLLLESLVDAQAAVPQDEYRPHPLMAAYRIDVIQTIDRLLGQHQLKLQQLLGSVLTNWISVRDLQVVDPTLKSLINLNQPADYEEALRLAGFE